MIDTIYIPTLGRSSNQITFDNLPSNVQDICILVVQPHEVELYKNYPTLVLPDDYIGITETRKWIHIQAQDTKYGVFDDDLRFIERTPQGEKTKAPMDELGWEYALETTDKWLDDFSFCGFRQGDLPPTGKEYSESTSVNCAFFFNGLLLPKASDLDWSLPICEDIHLVLQLFNKGYNNRIWHRFGYISNILVEGGCNEWRTLDIINDNHAKLIKKFPEYVSWNGVKEGVMGGDFKKIKIQWKKCYLDSQKSKVTLEGFMNE